MNKSGYKPISDYGIIGNMLSAALVGMDGSINWCCLPRFDSHSVFAAILDNEQGGRFQINPRVPFESIQAYILKTNVLQTTFRTDTGAATVTDFMPCYQTARYRVTRFQSEKWLCSVLFRTLYFTGDNRKFLTLRFEW